ncbi:MAG: hypothetical protein ACLFM0_03025 [Spirochaetales bacterium]
MWYANRNHSGRAAVSMAGVAAAALALLLGGCASTQEREPDPSDEAVQPFVVLEHRGSSRGVDAPEWVRVSLEGAQAVEQMDEFEDKYAVIVEETGEDLRGVEMWAQNFSAPAQIAQRVSTRVEQRFAGSAAGEVDEIDTYMENVVKTLSDAQFSGFSRAGEWWVKYRWYEEDRETVDRDEYRYMVLYTIDRDVLDRQVDSAISAAEAEMQEPETENERTVREHVRRSLREEGL